MASRYVLIEESLKDIRDHKDYLLSNANQEVAHNFVISIFDKFQLLADYPNVGKPRTNIKSGFFSFPDTKYKRTIFYKKISVGVRILAVLGGYQDHKRHLRGRK